MSKRSKGIFYMVLSALSATLMTLFIQLAGELPSFQKTLFRNVIAVAVSYGVIAKEGVSLKVDPKDLKLILLRAVLGTVSIFGTYYAADHLIIADASILGQLCPFFTLLFSWAILREKATAVHILCAVVAFTGAMFIIKPTGNMVNSGAIAGVIGGISTGISYTIVRLLGKRNVSGAVIIFYFSVFALFATLPVVVFQFQPMTLGQTVCLILVGLCAAADQFAVTKAYYYAPANEISVFSYTQILFSAVAGLFLMHQVPDKFSIAGYFIVVGAAVAMYAYNRKKQPMGGARP